jgi:hypothetical protein
MFEWRRDIQHNDIQHNDTQQYSKSMVNSKETLVTECR